MQLDKNKIHEALWIERLDNWKWEVVSRATPATFSEMLIWLEKHPCDRRQLWRVRDASTEEMIFVVRDPKEMEKCPESLPIL